MEGEGRWGHRVKNRGEETEWEQSGPRTKLVCDIRSESSAEGRRSETD